EAASKGIETVNDARDEVRREKNAPHGLVRVAAPPALATAVVAPTIAQFVRQYPEVRIEVCVTGRQVDPVRDGFDLVVSSGKLPDSSSKVRSIGTLDAGIYASAAYLRERGTPRRPNDLVRHDCILRQSAGQKDRWELTGPSGAVVVAVDGHIRVDDLSTAAAVAVAHGGLVVLPVDLPARDATAGPLQRVLPDYVVRGEIGQIVYPASRHVPLRVAMLCDALLGFAKSSCPTQQVRSRSVTPTRASNGSSPRPST
ncbi:MAG TPA: substrate binding domain-containing protein, partial [Labilithrix sp.]|nr:substrate binding domain-containing protein [Labilithrix sp.]